MSHVTVQVKGRKKRSEYSRTNNAIYQQLKKERRERYQKMLSDYEREIKKIVEQRK
jgi:hypothetical protein